MKKRLTHNCLSHELEKQYSCIQQKYPNRDSHSLPFLCPKWFWPSSSSHLSLFIIQSAKSEINQDSRSFEIKLFQMKIILHTVSYSVLLSDSTSVRSGFNCNLQQQAGLNILLSLQNGYFQTQTKSILALLLGCFGVKFSYDKFSLNSIVGMSLAA